MEQDKPLQQIKDQYDKNPIVYTRPDEKDSADKRQDKEKSQGKRQNL